MNIAVLLAVAALGPQNVTGPEKGFLVIVGGGRTGAVISRRFVDLAGGSDANFVVIPTANGDSQINVETEKSQFMKGFGVKNVVVLHTRDRKVADSAEFAEPLRHAKAVWLGGGRQWRLADSYLGTQTEREIKAVLDRGGVVGGSSAGATIQGSFLVRGASGPGGGDGDNTIMMSPEHLVGFGLMKNVAIDQHVITRHREGDLDPVIAKHPELLGIGIDESTAIVVHGTEFEVIGKSSAIIHDGKDHSGKPYYFLDAGQKFDLAKLAVKPSG